MRGNTNCSKSEQYSHSHTFPIVQSVSYEDSFSIIPSAIPRVLQETDVYVESKLVYTTDTSLGTRQTLAVSHNEA